jgi:hypothetical protein
MATIELSQLHDHLADQSALAEHGEEACGNQTAVGLCQGQISCHEAPVMFRAER